MYTRTFWIEYYTECVQYKYTHSGSSPLIIYPKNLHCLQLKHIYTMGMQFAVPNFPKKFALFLQKNIEIA